MDMTQSVTEDFDFNAEIDSLISGSAYTAEKRDSKFPDWNYPSQGIEKQVEAQWALDKETRAELDELEREEQHHRAVFQATCVEMEHKMLGGGRTPDRVKSVLAQHKQRMLHAKVNALRMAKMAMCSHLFDTVIARARAITPKVRQHGAVIRSTAKSGDSNSDDGGDPDPADTFIIDAWSFINANAKSTPENRILRKTILSIRNAPNQIPQRVTNWYFKSALRYIHKAMYKKLGRMVSRGHPAYDDVPAAAIRFLYSLAETHDFNQTPNPVAKSLIASNSFRCTYSLHKAATGGIFSTERKPDLTAGEDQYYTEMYSALNGFPKKPAKVAAKKSTKATDEKVVDDAEEVQEEEKRPNQVLLSSAVEDCLQPSGELYRGVKIQHIAPQPVSVYQPKGVIRHSFDASDVDDESPIDALLYREGAFFHTDEMETDAYSGEDADAVEAGNIARQLVQQVNHQTVSVDAVAKVILSQGEKGRRVIIALQKDLQNTDTCNQILTACGAELQSAPIDVAEAVVDIDDALQQVSDLGVDDLLMQNAPECLFHMKRLCGYCLNGQDNGSNFMTKLKNRAENKRKLFDPRISEVAGILLAGSKASTRKGGAA